MLTPARRRVLERLYEQMYPAAVAEDLGISRQAVHKHVKRLEQDGLIVEHPGETAFWRRSLGGGTTIKIYALTDAGLAALQEAPGGVNRDRLTEASPGAADQVNPTGLHTAPDREPRVEVHNFEVKIPVHELGIDWLANAADMQNWTRRWDPCFHGVYLEVTTKHILLRAAAEAPSKAMAEGLCLRKLLRVMELLERHYGCKLGRPEFRCIYEPGKTKIGVIGHPLSKDKGYEEGQLATIDSTPEPGTIHPTDDPNDADRIVQMARRAETTERLLQGLTEQQTHFLASLSRLLRPQRDEEPSQPNEPGMEIQ